MIRLLTPANAALSRLDAHLPLAARAVFAAVLAGYFWASALTKFEGPFALSTSAYVQIFPKMMEAAGYDAALLPFWTGPIAYAGSLSEFVLPLLIVIGLATRLAALGMIGFIAVQSLTDITGHGAGAATIGALFDRYSDALILDQRGLWVFVLAVLLVKGGGALSVDRAIGAFRNS